LENHHLSLVIITPKTIKKRKRAFRLTACVTGGWENQPTKWNQIPRLNQAQNAEPTSRPVHALLGGCFVNQSTP